MTLQETAEPETVVDHHDWVAGRAQDIEKAFLRLQRSKIGFGDFDRAVQTAAEEIVRYVRARYVPNGDNWPLPIQVV